MKRVVFIRPGETDWNRSGRWQGLVAVPLNEHGKQQARRLASFIRTIGLSALYSSDLRRAQETAEILAAELGFAPIYDARLQERDIGHWQGLTQVEVMNWYAEEYAALRQDPINYQIPGGESRKQVQDRVCAFCEATMMSEAKETIGVLSHSTAIHTLLTQLVPGYDPYARAFRNISVTTIARQADDTWRIVMLDDVSHLEGMEAMGFQEPEEGHSA